MKRVLTAITVAALALVGCNKMDAPTPSATDNRELGSIEFTTVIEGEMQTRASDVTEQGKEATISSVEIFCFDSGGGLVRYLANGTSKTGSISIPAGTYTVYAVINGPSAAKSVTTLNDLKAVTTSLGSDNGTSTDFVMSGSNTATVNASQTTDLSIDANRIAGRVKLVSIKNNCNTSLGSLTVKAVFLSNVYNTQNLACTATQALGSGNANWSNPYGRPRSNLTAGGKLTDSSTADDADLTFRTMSQSIAVGATNTAVASYYYAYPNSQTGNAAFSTTYAMSYTRLVVYASLNGVDYYYPVVLKNGIARNTSYDVKLTISGEGADDPQGEVKRGTVDVTIVPKPWSPGAEYNENL